MKSLGKVLSYLRNYWLFAALNALFNILSIFFSLVSFALFIPILQMLFKTAEIPEKVGPIVWTDMGSLKDNFYHFFGQLIRNYGEDEVLVYIGISIIVLFSTSFPLFPEKPFPLPWDVLPGSCTPRGCQRSSKRNVCQDTHPSSRVLF